MMFLKLKRYVANKLRGIPKYDVYLLWKGMNLMWNQFYERYECEEDPEEKKKLDSLLGLLDYWQHEVRKTILKNNQGKNYKYRCRYNGKEDK